MRTVLQRAWAWTVIAGLLVCFGAALANDQYPTGTGQYSPGEVTECQNTNGSVYSCALSDTAPYSVTVTKPGKAPAVNDRAQVVAISPNSGSAGQYPTGAVAITGNSTGTTGAVVGSLGAIPNKTTWICGFAVSALGGTAAVGPITIAGLIGSSMVYQLTSTAGGVALTQTFTPCIPASATNTAITITTTADGTASAVDVNSWGFQQ
jgi:hypothetical protein